MMMKSKKFLMLLVGLVAGGYLWYALKQSDSPAPLSNSTEAGAIYRQAQLLSPLHRNIGPVQSGDWLESHDETGQTFREYLAIDPVKLTPERNVLYVLPLVTSMIHLKGL